MTTIAPTDWLEYRYTSGASDNAKHALFEHLVPKLTKHATAIARGEFAPELDRL